MEVVNWLSVSSQLVGISAKFYLSRMPSAQLERRGIHPEIEFPIE